VEAHLRRAARAGAAPWLHVEVARRMSQRLEVVRAQPAVVIDWWAALGGGGEALRARYPKARVEAVEPTAALAERSARAAAQPWWSPSRWRGAPAVWREDEPPGDGHAQLLWSNMMLHWSAAPHELFARWQRLLAVDGFVMFSCFGPDTLKELQALYRRLGEPPAAHAFIDMHDLGDALLAAGFADPVMDMETLRLTWADATTALAELRTLGGNASAGRAAGLRTPRRQRRLLQEIETGLRDADGRVGLSFEIVYGHAFKPALRARGETRVSVDALRATARPAGRAGPA
jgi:malonyl-CoA O-methyltransferase